MRIAESWVELLGGLLLIVAAVYGVLEYSEHKAGLQVEQMERLHDAFDSPAMVERRARAAAAPGKFGQDAYEMFVFFEKVARWEEKGLINIEDLDYYFREPFLLYWYVWEPAIKDFRRREGQDPEKGDLYEGVQRVVTRMQNELDVKPPTDAQLRQWLQLELERAERLAAKPEAQKSTTPSETQEQPVGSEASRD